MTLRRHVFFIAVSAIVGLGIAVHEAPRERAWAMAHTASALPIPR
jgi:hypothetical protein